MPQTRLRHPFRMSGVGHTYNSGGNDEIGDGLTSRQRNDSVPSISSKGLLPLHISQQGSSVVHVPHPSIGVRGSLLNHVGGVLGMV